MIELARFRALSFDCYGTLIDWEQGILGEIRPWIARHGLKLNDDAILQAFAELEPEHQAAMPDKLYPQVLADVHRDLARRWDLPESTEAALAFGRSIGRWPAFADSAASLTYLKRHYKLVILSNVDRASFAESNRQLGVEFDRVITAQDVGSYKPDTKNFSFLIETLAAMGIPKDKLLHVGQSLFHDIAPAHAVGLSTVWVNRRVPYRTSTATKTPAAPAVPDLELTDLAGLVERHKKERVASSK